jgi:hypothetical protein
MLTNEQIAKSGIREKPYQFMYAYTRSMILALSGLSAERLYDIAVELETDLGVFLLDYKGPYLVDDHAYLVEMLKQWPTPWDAFDYAGLSELRLESLDRERMPSQPTPRSGPGEIGLNGLTLAQFFLAWAWRSNESAKQILGAEAFALEGSQTTALAAGIRAAVGAARSLAHAQALMASGDKRLGQNAP